MHTQKNRLMKVKRWVDKLMTSNWARRNTKRIKRKGRSGTWNEHIRVSSTLIMAPALSNSPQ